MAQKEILTMDLKEILPDPSRGPLEEYRKRGSFDWRKMKVLLETEEMIRYKHYIWNLMRNDPLFDNPHNLTLDETRHLTVKRLLAFRQKDLFPTEEIKNNPLTGGALMESLNTSDRSLASKVAITNSMFPNTIKGLGSDEQFIKYAKPALNGDIVGCFALTEIAHGSNIKGMRTTATFQPETKDFILHTPEFEGAKCWVGNLGKTATMAVVYAQLVSKGQQYGLNAFVVPIRCPHTLKPYSGVTIGDLGEKIGLNGIDNGLIMFDNYRLPFDSQLSRLGGVNTDGDYVQSIKDPSKKFGASLGVLSAGRVGIGGMANMYLQMGVAIATRYAAVRKQFSDTSDAKEETPIIEYQSVQTRLMPYLASVFAVKMFSTWFALQNIKISAGVIDDPKFTLAELGIEIHALSSATKPVCSWLSRDGLQMCRELCAGHGYLKSAGIGDIRNDNDANCTYEGENSVLIQQTFNWLMSLWSKRSNPETFNTPFNSVYYLKDADRILQQKNNLKSVNEATRIENILNAYKWLVTFMLKSTAERFVMLKKMSDPLKAKNDSQSYYGLPTSIAFVEHFILERASRIITEMEPSNETRVLLDLVSLFGSWLLEKYMGTLYMGGYWSESTSGQYLREAIISLCKKVSAESVLLVDAVAPPDFIFNTVLGASDGEMYKNLQRAVFTSPGAISRPDWWEDVVNWKSYVPAKL